MRIDPTKERLSEHFLLSDFCGNHSVYTQGLANLDFLDRHNYQKRIDNGIALCEHGMEPILQRYGPLSISYGYISPAVSRAVVGYQDPDKPSHHRWDLGAAADICVHGWVNSDPDDDSQVTAPALLAHEIAGLVPFSRLISYSESPYLCLALSAREIAEDKPRKAFYENRYTGVAKAKPDYFNQASEIARYRTRERLLTHALLAHGWRGAGYPTYHGGGRRQAQHVRVSQFTMLSDWLFDLQSVANGAKNMVNMRDRRLWEMLYAVGDAYDAILFACKVNRMSIIGGYVNPSNPYFDPANDWRSGIAKFKLVPPASLSAEEARYRMLFMDGSARVTGFGDDPNILEITVEL